METDFLGGLSALLTVAMNPRMNSPLGHDFSNRSVHHRIEVPAQLGLFLDSF